MFEKLMGGLIDKEAATKTTIKDALEDCAEELGRHTEDDPKLAFFPASHKEFFIMIQPTNEKMDFKFWLYKTNNGNPKIVRELTLKEILKLGE